jgi:hypothetical protein
MTILRQIVRAYVYISCVCKTKNFMLVSPVECAKDMVLVYNKSYQMSTIFRSFETFVVVLVFSSLIGILFTTL